jgi:predicted DNA-binding transcriptional regulator YafY
MASAPKDTASKLVSHIRVAPGPSNGPVDPVADVIQQALIGSVALEMTYRDGGGRITNRVVEPVGLLGTRRGWYLAAWCRLRDAPRAFRLDRIEAATLTDETVAARSVDAIMPDLPFEVAEPALM